MSASEIKPEPFPWTPAEIDLSGLLGGLARARFKAAEAQNAVLSCELKLIEFYKAHGINARASWEPKPSGTADLQLTQTLEPTRTDPEPHLHSAHHPRE